MPRLSVAIFLSPEELQRLDDYRAKLDLSRGQAVVHLLDSVDTDNPKPGERRVVPEDY